MNHPARSKKSIINPVRDNPPKADTDMPKASRISNGIFKAYDIRGRYPDEINEDVVRRLAFAFVAQGKRSQIVIGEDGRVSSPSLKKAAIEGALLAGCRISDLGKTTTPLFYFAVRGLQSEGGIMVTASHNPVQDNGLRFAERGGMPFEMEDFNDELLDIAQKELPAREKSGTVEELSLLGDYIGFLARRSRLRPGDISFSCVVDAGNGVAGITIEPLFKKLGINYFPLNFSIDENFRNHPPNPLAPGALDALRQEVIKREVAVGFALDGDADRLVVIDEKGEIVPAQYILALLWQNYRSWFGKPKVVYDLRFSKAIRDLFGKYGTRSMVGHTFVADMMRWKKADLGAETTGHFFFKDTNYVESSELAVLKLLGILARSKKPLSELVKPFEKYAYSGEMTLPTSDKRQVRSEKLEDLFVKLQRKYSEGKWDKFDGLTIDLWDADPPVGGWWFNLRPSNTEPLIRLVVEAKDQETMEQKRDEIMKIVKEAA